MKYENKRHNSFDSRDNLIRLAILGPSKVGKSSLVKRYLHDTFDDKYSKTIEDIHKERQQDNGLAYEVDILDTCGSRECQNLRNSAIRNSDGFILVYSLDDRKSFEEMLDILAEITTTREDFESTPIIFVANKKDAEKKRKNSLEVRKCYTDMVIGHENVHVESSAKENINVSFIFDLISRKVITKKSEKKKKRRPSSLFAFFKKSKGTDKVCVQERQRRISFCPS